MKNQTLPLNKILLGDNIELFKQIPDNSIDLIFADPPYNMNLQKDLIRYDGSKFDGVDDEWDKYESLEEYDKECKLWLAECLRVLKKNGSLWVIGSFQNIHRLGYILQDMGAWIINEIVWEKSNPVPNFSGTRFVNAQETMLWVTKNSKAKFTFNYKTMKHMNGGTQMKSIWKLPICTGSERLKDEDGKKIHSTQKPLALLERIIIACSKPNDIVLDPFSGTATTAHAAKMLGRKYIGFEKDKTYYEQSILRLNSVIKDENKNDLINAIYDAKPKKVDFIDLINKNYISTNDKLRIITKDYELHFNKNGDIEFEGETLTPNKLCRKIFNKPANAWDVIMVNDMKLSEIREKYRAEN
ncbi:DNA-methyltransferase [Metamycoplasma hyosynoviae]|uniref:DNA-methyltransferase n=1 Tax=Metamycoplasma hyosynoviae TaxID=29559 RepID=UPI00235DCB33|nr:site-specific DNA-methyltransferase [Metamycoplasma hyosynoviae]MDD1379255.1 site-specific DNA-methyltransferase [Metamycoplasma hyosynoviae]MDD7847521.1 site-specific DNA-methyltransferase [Metamycoplasma hyosynoviae]MDD7894165.1 site-specific DNA-methyltransferase [Metamycoplasma hyosynoviae]